MVDVVDELFDQILKEVVPAGGVVGVAERPERFGHQFQYPARNDCSNQNGNRDLLGDEGLRLIPRTKTESLFRDLLVPFGSHTVSETQPVDLLISRNFSAMRCT